MNNTNIIDTALTTIQLEADSVANLKNFINDDFEKVLQCIVESKGRLVVSGIGKSAIIAQKIVATLNSTGTPSVYMHSADAIHGDLGMVLKEDVVLIISKSGDSPEIKTLIPLIKNFGNTIIGMVGNLQSFLASQCDIVLNTTVDQEACPNNLAPTTSTTAQMVMGDALAVCLMKIKGFNTSDFARFHPGGALGKRLYLQANHFSTQNQKPSVLLNASVTDAIVEISKKRLGATAVLNDDSTIAGIITDGDLRRMLAEKKSFTDLMAKDIMSANPKTINGDALAVEALEVMRTYDISQLIVIDNNNTYSGVIHLHDLIREGII